MATNRKNAPLALPIGTLLGLPIELTQIKRVNQLQPSPLREVPEHSVGRQESSEQWSWPLPASAAVSLLLLVN